MVVPVPTEIKPYSPDKLLLAIGARNRFLLFIWIAMAILWGIGALPIMASAFLMDDFCKAENVTEGNGTDAKNCIPQKGTVTEEFHLDAAHSFLVDLTTSAYIGGMALGSICMPLIADNYGRRPAILSSLFLSGIFGFASSLSPNIYAFIGLRFIQGLSFSGCILVNWVLAYECVPIGLRSGTALLFGLVWVVGYCLVAPMAFFLANWRQLIAAASAPSLLIAIIYFFTIPESLHFLASKRRLAAIRKWIERANKCAEFSGTQRIEQNEVDNFVEYLEMNQIDKPTTPSNDESDESQKTRSTLLIYLVISVYIWTCDTFIYYGLSLFSTQLAGNRYFNFTLVALAEVPSYVFAPFLLDRMGRRLFTVFMHFLASIAFLLALPLNGQPQVFLFLWLIGKFAISSSFTGLFVYSSEIFPTIRRNICMGICTTVSQASGIFAPTVRLMANISPKAPMLFFGLCSLLACFFTFFLPETRGRELPERKIVS